LFQIFVSGSGDELITPVYTPPPRPKWKDEDYNSNSNANSNNGANICDDDEDCRESGSGGFFEGLLFTGTFPFFDSRNLSMRYKCPSTFGGVEHGLWIHNEAFFH
jgi:hypothetical protein